MKGGAQCMHAASSGARAKHVTTTKSATSYMLSRLSAQASYHHLLMRLGLKVILRQWTLRSAPPSWPQCWNTRSNKSQVSVAFVTGAAPGLWHTCGYLMEAHEVQCHSRWCWLAVAALFCIQEEPGPGVGGLWPTGTKQLIATLGSHRPKPVSCVAQWPPF